MPRFNPDVNYQVRREGGRYIVINRDRNRRMRKTFVTRREANAHVAQTKRRVAQIIGYHNRVPANARRNNRQAPPPANRNPVGNVGRAENPRRRGRRPRQRAEPETPPATPPRRNNAAANRLQRQETVRTPARRPQNNRPRTQGLARGRTRRNVRKPRRFRDD